MSYRNPFKQFRLQRGTVEELNREFDLVREAFDSLKDQFVQLPSGVIVPSNVVSSQTTNNIIISDNGPYEHNETSAPPIIPGKPGKNGTNGTNGKNAPFVILEGIKEDYRPTDILPGNPGKNGSNGTNGRNANTIIVDGTKKDDYVPSDIIPGKNGTNGTTPVITYQFPFQHTFTFVEGFNNSVGGWMNGTAVGQRVFGAAATNDWAFPPETAPLVVNIVPLPSTSFTFSPVTVTLDVWIRWNTFSGGVIANSITWEIVNNVGTTIASATSSSGPAQIGYHQIINTTLASIVGTTGVALAVTTATALSTGDLEFVARLYIH